MKWFATCAMSVALTAGTLAQAPTEGVVAFTGARLITLDPKPAVTDVVILMKDGRVTAVGPPKSIAVPSGIKRVNLGGGFVMPGLISGHVHVSDVAGPDAARLHGRKHPAPARRVCPIRHHHGAQSRWRTGARVQGAGQRRTAWPETAPRRSRILVSGDIITGATPDAARQGGRRRRGAQARHHQDSRRRQPRHRQEDDAGGLSAPSSTKRINAACASPRTSSISMTRRLC